MFWESEYTSSYLSIIMKRVFKILAIAVLGTLPLTAPLTAVAQNNYSQKELKAFAKDAESEAKKAAKKLEKEKWIYNGVGTLPKAYERFLLSTSDFGGVGEARTYEINGASNLRNGEKSLINMAQATYAQENEAYLKLEQASHSGEVDVTIEDNVVKALAEFNGDVKRSFIIYKKNTNGTYDMRGYFIIDGNNTRAKLRRLAKDLSDEVELSSKIKKAAGGE